MVAYFNIANEYETLGVDKAADFYIKSRNFANEVKN